MRGIFEQSALKIRASDQTLTVWNLDRRRSIGSRRQLIFAIAPRPAALPCRRSISNWECVPVPPQHRIVTHSPRRAGAFYCLPATAHRR
jgi:hypothetical protein